MKKILLSCVTCLLAIGLVTACEDEDEVTSGGGGDSTTQDSGTGGVSDTGSGGGAEEVTTLYNYTLELTLTDEDGNDPIPSYATAYIIGDWDNWVEFLPLTGGDKVYSYTFESIDVGWYEFKAVMWYTDETVTWDDCVEIVTVPYEDEETGQMKEGNAYFEVAASQGDDYKCQLEYTVTKTLEPRVVSVTSITLDPTTLSFAYEDIAESKNQTITASVIGSDGSVMEDEEVSWASDTETVATVEAGVVTPVATGSATITATSVTDENVFATCSVYVGASGEVLVEKVEIEPNELTLTMDDAEEGNSATITATVSGADGATPTNPEVSWSQTGDVIEIGDATQTELVSEVTVTAAAAGSGTLTATAGGVTASIPVTVEPVDDTVTLTIYFVDGAEPSNYYSLPSYSDAEDAYKEVVAYVEYVKAAGTDGETWVDPDDKTQSLKLISNGSAEDGYTVTLGSMEAGTIGIKIFFEWASEEGSNSESGLGDWDYYYPSDGSTLSVEISAELAAKGGDVSLLVPVDPATVIYPPSDSDLISVTVGIKNTGTASSTHTFKIKGGRGSESWVETTLETYSGDYSEQIDLAYTYTEVNKTSQKLEFEIYDGSESWGNGVGAYFINTDNDSTKEAGSIPWSTDNYYLYCTSSGGPTWGLDLPALNTADSSKLSGVTELIVILNFDFDSYSTSDNLVVSSTDGFSFVAVK